MKEIKEGVDNFYRRKNTEKNIPDTWSIFGLTYVLKKIKIINIGADLILCNLFYVIALIIPGKW